MVQDLKLHTPNRLFAQKTNHLSKWAESAKREISSGGGMQNKQNIRLRSEADHWKVGSGLWVECGSSAPSLWVSLATLLAGQLPTYGRPPPRPPTDASDA